jgi:hypothetical protein
VSGSGYSIVCLGRGGQPLGGFSKTHSLNAWCADPIHTNHKHAPNPALVNGVWMCTGSGSAAQPSPKPSGGSVSVPIPLGAACKWAYPAQASGQVSGSGYSIVCLGMSGQPLGGFSSDHSLNAWCADPSHTDHKHLPDPELHKGKWVCTKT